VELSEIRMDFYFAYNQMRDQENAQKEYMDALAFRAQWDRDMTTCRKRFFPNNFINSKIFEVSHLQFAYHRQTCQIYPSETSYIAKNREKVIHLNGHLLKHCAVEEHPICHIPRYNNVSRQSIHCAVGMLARSSFEDLRSNCAYQCSVLMTNVDNVTATCNGKTNHYYFERIGANR